MYLIRHCEAEGNIYRRVHGSYDGRPMPNGYLQCKALAERFSGVELSAVYASDLQRARFTAEHLSEPRELAVNADARFREINLGIWEDRTWGEVARDYPREWALFTAPSVDFAITGGETFVDVGERMMAGLRDICRKHTGAIALVSHGIAIKCAIGLIQGAYDGISHCDNTGVSKIDVSANGDMTVDFYGDNSHLGELSTIEKQAWWRKGIYGKSDMLLCFDPVVLPEENDIVEMLRREAWMAVYSSTTGYYPDQAQAETARCAMQHPRAVTLVRDQGGEVLGLVVLDTAFLADEGRGHIALVALSEAHRGKGIGPQLIGHAISLYRSLGRKVLHLRVAENNVRAIAMYKKVGFVPVGTEEAELKRLVKMEMGI